MPSPTVEEIARFIDPRAFDNLDAILDLWGSEAAKCASYAFTCDRVSKANKAATRLLNNYTMERK